MKPEKKLLLIIFASLFQFLISCERFKSEGEKKASEELKRYQLLTEKILDTVPDNNLMWAVFSNLSNKISKDYEKEYKTVMSWNKSQQAIYITWLLEGEVNNGGFNQFYSNSSGQFYKEAPDALKHIGANRFAELTNEANNVFEKDNLKITKDQDGTIEGFSKSYENNPLNDFDTKFYDLYKNENLEKIEIDYIRKHKTDFIDK
jgi:hypothetical protein